jgi:hypothetical protein
MFHAVIRPRLVRIFGHRAATRLASLVGTGQANHRIYRRIAVHCHHLGCYGASARHKLILNGCKCCLKLLAGGRIARVVSGLCILRSLGMFCHKNKDQYL